MARTKKSATNNPKQTLKAKKRKKAKQRKKAEQSKKPQSPKVSETTPPFPVHKWPYKPHWSLSGFDFSSLPVFNFKPGVRALLRHRAFTSGISSPNSPSEADYSSIAANNVAVQFQAMLYCKDLYLDDNFWERISQLSLQQGPRNAQMLETLFMRAREAYLQTFSGCPNDAARLVDEWIAFMDSVSAGQPARPSVTDLPERLDTWRRMRKRELVDCGVALSPEADTRASAWYPGPPQRNRGASSNAKAKHPEVVVIEDSSDDSSSTGASSPEPEKSVLKRKREESQSSATSRPYLPKRQARVPQQTSNTAHSHRLRSASLSSSSQDGTRPGRRAPTVSAEDESVSESDSESSSASEEEEASGVAPSHVTANHSAIDIRVTDCEVQLAHHTNLINRHRFELSEQEELDANHTTRLDAMDIRLRSIEQIPSAGDQFETLRKSVTEIEDRLNTRSTYIRSEVRKHWNDVCTPLEKTHNRLSDRLDTVRDDLVVHKTRIEDCQKAVEGHTIRFNDQEKENGRIKTLKKGAQKQGARIDELSVRVTELEDKINNGGASTSSEARNPEYETPAQAEAQLGDLTERVVKLEKEQRSQKNLQRSVIDKIFRRLEAVEADNASLRRALGVKRGAPEQQVGQYEPAVARQERVAEPSRMQVVRTRTESWDPAHRRAPAHAPAAPAAFVYRYPDYHRVRSHGNHF